MHSSRKLFHILILLYSIVYFGQTQTIKGCLSMYSNNTCKTCNSDYNWKLKSGKCQCSSGFTNPPGCSACLKPYSPQKYSSSSSSDYGGNGGNKCSKLKSKWDLKKRLKCGFCPDCDTTQGFKTSGTAMKCECKQGFFTSGSKCQPCSSKIPGCSKCSNATSCSSCLPAAFYWDNNAKICKACSENLPGCSTCSSPSSCSICSEGYVKNGVNCNACNSTMDGCTSCKPGALFVCLSCNISGNFQNTSGRCACKSGFVNRNKTCISCVQAYPGCTQCRLYPNGSDYCYSCDESLNFILDPILVGIYGNQTQCTCQPAHLSNVQQCVLCDFAVAGCITCNQIVGCVSCNDSLNFLLTPNSSTGLCDCISTFGKNDLNQCKPCQELFPGCLTCSGSPLACDTCQQSKGYFDYLNFNNSCQRCFVVGCSDCHDDINSCHFCNTPNYDIGAQFTVLGCGPCDLFSDNDPTLNNLCVLCSILNSQGCSQCNNGDCLVCNTGYYLGTDNTGKIICKLCRQANPGCEDCLMTDHNICNSCIGGQNFSLTITLDSKCQCLDNTFYVDTDSDYPYPLCLKCIDMNEVSHCSKCLSKDPSDCQQCQDGYFLQDAQCKLCNDTLNGGKDKCTLCSFSGIHPISCSQCEPGYFVDGDICQLCLNQLCDQCDTATGLTCSSCKQFAPYNFKQNDPNCICKDGFTKLLFSDTQCQINCTEQIYGCTQCTTHFNDSILCTSCSIQNFEPTIDGLCSCTLGFALSDQICVQCSQVVDECVSCTSSGTCLQCTPGLKPDTGSSGMNCIPCDVGCAVCTDTLCITPQVGYLIQMATLKRCYLVFNNCLQCTQTECTKCLTSQYALNLSQSNQQCFSCNEYSTLSGCLHCSNSTYCSQCDSTINFMPNGNGQCICQDTFAFDGNNCGSCQSFMSKCLNCLDNNTCIQCDLGFQINSSNNHCKPCSVGCLSCDPDIGCFGCDSTANFRLNDTDTKCYCEDGYALTVNNKCETVCGDGIFMSAFENCDDGNINNGDGCSSICTSELDWSCSNRQFMKSICGFQGVMAIEFQNVTKSPLSNQVTLTFSVGPTLQGLKTIDFTAAFSSNLKLSNPTYIYNPDGTVSLTYDYSETLEGQEAQFTFDPSLASSAFYAVDPISSKLRMSTNNNQPITYYNPQTYTQVPKFKAAFMAGQALSYAILVGGMFCDKIIGIQLFGVWQIAFFTMSNIDYIQPLLSPLLDFKSLNGYNFGFCSNCESVPMRVNAITYKSQISSNFNVMLIVLLLEAAIAVVLFGVSKLALSLSQKLADVSQKMLKQYLLMITLFNTLNIGYSIGIQVTYGSAKPLDIVISVVSILFLIGSAAGLSFAQKQGYGQFQNYFRRDWMSQFYFQYTIAYRFALGILMSQLNQISSVTIFSFFLATAFLMYQMVNLPYKSGYQNYRAMLHQVSAIVIIGISMYYRSMKANEPVNVASTLLSPAYLQMFAIYSCISMSGGVLIYELYHKFFKQWIQNIQQYIKNRPQPAKQLKTVESEIIGQAENTFDKSNIFWTEP